MTCEHKQKRDSEEAPEKETIIQPKKWKIATASAERADTVLINLPPSIRATTRAALKIKQRSHLKEMKTKCCEEK